MYTCGVKGPLQGRGRKETLKTPVVRGVASHMVQLDADMVLDWTGILSVQARIAQVCFSLYL
jgi:hypothetical protein